MFDSRRQKLNLKTQGVQSEFIIGNSNDGTGI